MILAQFLPEMPTGAVVPSQIYHIATGYGPCALIRSHHMTHSTSLITQIRSRSSLKRVAKQQSPLIRNPPYPTYVVTTLPPSWTYHERREDHSREDIA
jgi:hypothetical protein